MSQIGAGKEELEKKFHEHIGSSTQRKEIIKVSDNIYVAAGFGLANSILIEGDDGVVIIDTMENNEVAR